MTTTQGSWHVLLKFRHTCRDETLEDDLPSATHTRIPFQAYVPSAEGQKEGSWSGEGGGKVTDIAENQYGDVSSKTEWKYLPQHGTT